MEKKHKIIEGVFMFLYKLAWILAWIPLKILYPTKVIGKENLPKKKKAILACNHMSNRDSVVLQHVFPRKAYFLAKMELFKKKFTAGILKFCGGVPVDRSNVGISSIKTVLKLLKDEEWVVIFPEGTRHDTENNEDLDAAKNGMSLFALKAGAPIVPMWFVKKPRPFRKTVLLVGKPMDLSSYMDQKPTKEVLDEVTSKVLSEMYQLRDDYLKAVEDNKMLKNAKKEAKKAKKSA